MTTRDRAHEFGGVGGALTSAIERDDLEHAALLLLVAVSTVLRRLPRSDIDDVIALLTPTEDGDAPTS